MRRFFLLLLPCALLAFSAGLSLPARADKGAARAEALFQADVSVTDVDVDRDRVQVTDDSGHAYTLDTYQSAIALRGTDRPGSTGDLVPGMRLRVRGTLASTAIVEAETVRVLPFRAAPIAAKAAETVETGPVSLRGTVESVDSHNHLIVVRVRDHERTVYISPQTDLQDVAPANAAHLAYLPGERVTVEGAFQPDGTVLANIISRKIQPAPRASTPLAFHSNADASDFATLTGPVVKQSSRYGSRDIKVRTGGGHEVTVHVPHDAQIFRDGRLISVHDLAKSDVVRVRGTADGSDFRASRIDVVRSNDQGL